MNAQIASHLNIVESAIKEVQVWANVIWVRFVGGCKFVSKKVVAKMKSKNLPTLIGLNGTYQEAEILEANGYKIKSNVRQNYFEDGEYEELVILSPDKKREFETTREAYRHFLNPQEFERKEKESKIAVIETAINNWLSKKVKFEKMLLINKHHEGQKKYWTKNISKANEVLEALRKDLESLS